MKRILVTPLLLLGSLFGQVSPVGNSGDTQKLLPEFNYTKGWLGADDAFTLCRRAKACGSSVTRLSVTKPPSFAANRRRWLATALEFQSARRTQIAQ